MMPRTWEWQLGTGEVVRAKLHLADDPALSVERVWLGKREISVHPVGELPDGHAVSLPSGKVARVVFDDGDDIANCTLSIDGEVVPPTRAPKPRRASTLLIVAGMILAALGAYFLLSDVDRRARERNLRRILDAAAALSSSPTVLAPSAPTQRADAGAR